MRSRADMMLNVNRHTLTRRRSRRSVVRWPVAGLLALLALSGCHAFTTDVDGQLAARAAQPIDVQRPSLPQPEQVPDPAPLPSETTSRAIIGPPATANEFELVAWQPPKEKQKTIMERLEFKEGILGFRVPDLNVP